MILRKIKNNTINKKTLIRSDFFSTKNIFTIISIGLLIYSLGCSSNVKAYKKDTNSTDSLLTNNANLFGELATIKYKIENQKEENNSVTIMIYDVKGNIVRNFFNGFQLNGKYKLEWDKKDNNNVLVDTGIYYCRIVVNGKHLEPIKILLAKESI